MFSSLFFFELRGHMRRWTTWLYFGILFLLEFASVFNVALGSGYINVPLTITLSYLASVMLGQIITSALAGRSIARDSDVRVHELLSATRLTRTGYLAAKFLAAFAAMLLVFCALPLSALAASMVPWIDPGSVVPINLWYYVQPFLTIVVPDVFFVSALFFAVGAVTRKQFVVVMTGVLLSVGTILVSWFPNEQLAKLLDPFGAYTVTTVSLAVDVNSGVVPLTCYLLRNRLLWLGIGLGLIAVAFLTVKLATDPPQRWRARRAVLAFAIISVALFMVVYRLDLAQDQAGRDATQLWLASHAIRLRTVEARNGFEDMQPLKQVIGNTHVVALGEATHGTREFFQFKHRMLEFLVSEMGFTVFGIEATMPEAFAVNDYVLTGKGDPARALAGLYFWTWNTEEVLDMIQWMREYNADPTHLKKVKFYGFDMQAAPLATKVTLAYLRRVDPEQAARAEKSLAQLANPMTNGEYSGAPVATKAAVMAAIGAVLARFDARKGEYIATTSEREWAVARQHASIVAQNLEMRNRPAIEGIVRDSAMAANIRWILDQEGPAAKMVVWAHNLHVRNASPWMGSDLRKALGSDMVVFGFAFNEGGFQAIEYPSGLRSFTVVPAPEGSLDRTLADAGLQIAAVDLRTLPTDGPVAKWFAAPRKTRSIGATFTEQGAAAAYFVSQVMPRTYDALFFVEKTTAARKNRSSTGEAPTTLTRPTNLDFEAGEQGQPPDGWITPASMVEFGFEATTTSDHPFSGKRSAMLSRPAGDYYGESVGSLTQRIDATAFRGKHIRLRVMARTDAGGAGGQAYIGLALWNPDEMNSPPVSRTVASDAWQACEIEVDVPSGTIAISYGAYLTGTGHVWMDAVSIEVVPKSKPGGE